MRKNSVVNISVCLFGLGLFFLAIHFLFRGQKLSAGADTNSLTTVPIPGSLSDNDILQAVPSDAPPDGAPNVPRPNLANRAARVALGVAADAAGTILHPTESLKTTGSSPNTAELPTITGNHGYQDRGGEVVLINEALAYYGGNVNPDSPVFSYFTVMAIRDVQSDSGIEQDDPEYGEVGIRTRPILNQALAILIDLKVNPVAYIPADIQLGERGGGAYALNLALEQKGYYGYSGFIFTAKTRALLTEFQADHKLPPTGQVDAATLAELRATL